MLDAFTYSCLMILIVFFCFEIISFEDEPGKQVRSAVRIKNTSKSPVAFKVMQFRFFFFFFSSARVYVFAVGTCNYAWKLGEMLLYKTISHRI